MPFLGIRGPSPTWTIATLAFICGSLVPESLAASAVLAPGSHLERSITAGEAHPFRATLEPGKRYRIELEQLGIALELRAIGPDDAELAVDSPTYRHGRETLLLPAGAAGR